MKITWKGTVWGDGGHRNIIASTFAEARARAYQMLGGGDEEMQLGCLVIRRGRMTAAITRQVEMDVDVRKRIKESAVAI